MPKKKDRVYETKLKKKKNIIETKWSQHKI